VRFPYFTLPYLTSLASPPRLLDCFFVPYTHIPKLELLVIVAVSAVVDVYVVNYELNVCSVIRSRCLL
jgi:hypothetical protein